MVWKYMTAGESHGPAVLGFLEGMPSGMPLSAKDVNPELARRQVGYGRGARMAIEKDTALFIGGVRFGRTTGAPLALQVENRGREQFDRRPPGYKPIVRPRPGHTDLAGALKYGFDDMRDVLERASARETAARCALGACAKKLLLQFGIEVRSLVERIGAVQLDLPEKIPLSWWKRAEKSELRCPREDAEVKLKAGIDKAIQAGDSLGGVVRVEAFAVPPGLGSHAQWDRKIEGRLGGAFMALPGVKAVESGSGYGSAGEKGSNVHDVISYSEKKPFGYYRTTNRAGGIEGGITNGENVVFHLAMKPIPTLGRPLKTVDIKTRKAARAAVVRADVCAVPALGVIAESVMALELAGAMREKFGGDSLRAMKTSFTRYIKEMRR